ncbi:MAG: hypothetical protein QXD61_10345 [Candidatus Caldarchaeum sp.]
MRVRVLVGRLTLLFYSWLALGLWMCLRGMASQMLLGRVLGGGFVGWGEPSTLHVRLVAVDEAVGKRLGERVYLWSAVDVYASKGRPILNALVLLRMHVRA